MTKIPKGAEKRDQGIGLNGSVKKRNRCRVHCADWVLAALGAVCPYIYID